MSALTAVDVARDLADEIIAAFSVLGEVPADLAKSSFEVGAIDVFAVELEQANPAAYRALLVSRDLHRPQTSGEIEIERLRRAAHPVTDVTDVTDADEGNALLDEVRGVLTRHVAFPTAHHSAVAAAWVAHCHLIEAFDTTPRLAAVSAEMGSGKTRLLEVIEPMVPTGELLVTPSPSVMFRMLDQAEGRHVLLLDECDAAGLGGGKLSDDQEQVRAIINAGYRRGATVARSEMVGKNWEPRHFNVFGPVVLAGIGDLPATVFDRSVVIPMKRRRPEDRVAPWRNRMRGDLEPLRHRLAAWASTRIEEAVALDADPHFLPDGVEDRLADVWGPLVITAAVAGPRWHELLVDACTALVSAGSDRAASLGVRLLADIRTVFTDGGVEQMATTDLLRALHALEDAPWGDLRGAPIEGRFLSRKLGAYDVRPRLLNLGGDDRARGYALRHDTDGVGGLADPFSRYLPALTSVTSVTGTGVTDVTAAGGGCLG